MATATKSKRRPASGGNGRGHFAALVRAAKAARPDKIEARQLAVKSIDPSPYQPRAEFPEEEIRGLAESIARQGQLHPIMVRPKGNRYELVDGERRLRAVKLIGAERMRAEVCEFSDSQARQIILVSALQRKDLGPIEEARAFKASLAAGDFAGPTELAAALGLSQGQVSNRLRLLELPKDVQAKIISQEIPATHGRELARFKEHPELVSALAEDLVKDAGYNGMPTVEDFRNGLVHDVARRTELVSGEEWDEKSGRRVPRFAPTPEQRKELGIVSVEQVIHGKARPLEFATNQAAHKKMQAKWKKQWLKDNPAGKTQGSGVRGQGPAKKKAKKLSPAQEAARAKELDRQHAKRRREFYIDWTKLLIGTHLGDCDWTAMQKVVLFLMATGGAVDGGLALMAAIESHGGKVKQRRLRGELLRALGELSELDLPGVTTAAVAACFWDKAPVIGVVDDDVVLAAEILGIDHEADWLEDQAGELSEAWWNLHSREELVEEAKRQKIVEIKPSMKKAQMVKVFLAARDEAKAKNEAGLPLPKELKKIKRPR